jgi:hypothetical protein
MKRWTIVILYGILVGLLLAMVPVAECQTTRRVVFRVSWVNQPDIDSTAINVYLSTDTLPTLTRMSLRSPDTVSLPAPGDTLTYNFKLIAYRGTRASDPSIPASFYFDASRYFRVVRLVVGVNDGCEMFMFNDSTFVRRSFTPPSATCDSIYTQKIPPQYRVTNGYRQRKVDTICLLQDTTPPCTQDYVRNSWNTRSQSVYNVGTECASANSTVRECLVNTTVMDYRGGFSERYTAETTCYGITRYDFLTGVGCIASGWVYPVGIFPGRWETSYNYIMYSRSY